MTTQDDGWGLRQQRKSLGLSLREITDALVAHGCDVSHQTVSKWEQGTSSPTRDKLPAIAAAYEVDVRTVEDWYLDRAPERDDAAEIPGWARGMLGDLGDLSPSTVQAIRTLIEADKQARRR